MPKESAVRDPNGVSEDQSIERLRELLSEALGIVDDLKLSPDIGARLDEILRALEDPADT